MLVDLRGAQAVQEERVAEAEFINRSRPSNPGRHSLIERADTLVEAKLHEWRDAFRNRDPHHWHWPHPLTH